MEFRIADTFTDSLAKLTGDEQKAVKTTAFDLQMDPSGAGHSFHKLDRAKDRNFWSVRVSRNIRLIVHRTASSVLLAYVDHHDAAYRWAERRRIERHPKTGAAQIVEIRETVREIEVPRPIVVKAAAVARAASKPALFAEASDDELLGYGVPETWLEDVRGADEDSLLDLADHLPAEAAEALLELATGGTPDRPAHAAADTDPFGHPDAQRRFRLVENADELERALEFPWEKWTVFLHPAQRRIVEAAYSGPARVSGSAGTGKTIVALHRAVHLARAHPDARVLLTTFSDTLANALRVRLGRLVHNQPSITERLEVNSMGGIGRRLYEANFGAATLVTEGEVRALIDLAAAEVEVHAFNPHFLWTEWSRVIDAWQLDSWEAYRDVVRLGRKTRLAESQRAVLWSIFSRWCATSSTNGDLLTEPRMFRHLERHVADASASAVRVLRHRRGTGHRRGGAALSRRPRRWPSRQLCSSPATSANASSERRSRGARLAWTCAGALAPCASTTAPPIRSVGRRIACCRLSLSDVDGITEKRGGTVSAFNGPEPGVQVLESPDEEAAADRRLAYGAPARGFCAARDRRVRTIRRRDREGTGGCPPGGPKLDRIGRTLGRGIRQGRRRDDASRQRTGVPSSGGHGVRRRGFAPAITHRERGRRSRPGRHVQHGTAASLRCLHTCP